MNLWLVYLWKGENAPPEFQGVFSRKERAVEVCTLDHMCICPAVLDEELPIGESIEWPGCWYPRLEPEPVFLPGITRQR